MKLFLSLMVMVLLLVSEQIMAQSSSGGVLEEVVVTAEKREESLQNAPVSVTALSGDTISQFNATDVTQLASRMPSVRFMGGEGGNGQINVVIRGIGTYNNQPNVDMAVAWNVDGTYLSHHMAIPPILFDINRMEVVRGPQGTLYGKNSNGGSINIVTNKPVLGETLYSAEVGYGNYNQVDSNFMVNIPLGKNAALRLAAANDYSDGYYDDGSYGTDNYAARARLLVEPSDNFNLIATLEWSNVDGSGPGLDYCPPQAYPAHPACAGVPWKPWRGLGTPGVFAANGLNGPPGHNGGFSQRENWGAYLEWNYRWEAATLTSISNYHKYDRAEYHVWEFVTYKPIHHNTYVTQELRLASNPGSRFDWVIGAFFADEQSKGRENFGTVAADLETQVVNNYYGVDDGRVVTRAVFGDITYPVMDHLRLTGGLRWTYERKHLLGSAATNLIAGPPVYVDTGSTLKEKGKVTWSAGLEYDLTDHNMLYFKADTGFKSGTVNQIPATVTAVNQTTSPEEITAYQFGSKNTFMGDRLRINGELFYYDYTGYQLVITATDPSGFFPGVFFPSVNAQKARSYGGEIESSFIPWEHGQFDMTLTYTDARHTKYVTPLFDWSGHKMLSAPEYTIMASYSHEWELSNGGMLSGIVSTMFTDGYYTHDSNDPGSFQPSYTETSMSMVYRHPDSHWSIRGWVRNLENNDVINVSQSGVGRGGWNVFIKPPRMFGFSVKYEN